MTRHYENLEGDIADEEMRESEGDIYEAFQLLFKRVRLLERNNMMTIVGRCKDCKHYKLEDRYSLIQYPPSNVCELTYYYGEKENKESLAHAEDAEAYFAVLVVSPEFGCVQFQQRV